MTLDDIKRDIPHDDGCWSVDPIVLTKNAAGQPIYQRDDEGRLVYQRCNCPRRDKIALLERSDFDGFQAAFSEWAFATFPGQTVEAKLRHAIKEIGEIIDNPGDVNEWGDLFMLMCNAAKKQGFALSDILQASRDKWQNDLVHRKWLPPDEDGCVHHVKAAEEAK